LTTLLDGAMGTELSRRGAPWGPPLWSARALVDAPQIVEDIHVEYLLAGADVITADAFCCHPWYLDLAGPEVPRDLATRAVEAARSARTRAIASDSRCATARIAASVSMLPPTAVCDLSVDERARQYRTTARALVYAGCDLVLLETMTERAEAMLALAAVTGLGVPVWLAFAAGQDGLTLAGDDLGELAADLGTVDVILVNCSDMVRTTSAIRRLAQTSATALGCYPNTFAGESDEQLVDSIAALVASEPRVRVVGGCCGTTPHTTARLREHFGREP
jgi:homocysteine S-methyltransferase